MNGVSSADGLDWDMSVSGDAARRDFIYLWITFVVSEKILLTAKVVIF